VNDTGENSFSDTFFSIFTTRNIVFIAMLAVGMLCIFMSARNTASYLMLTGMDKMVAVMTGVALIIFSATSFTAAQLFLAQQGAAKLFSILFIAVGITVITFSIFSTLSLNYSKFVSSEAIQADIAEKTEKRRSEIMEEYNSKENQAEAQDVNKWVMGNIDRLMALSEQSGESWSRSMQVLMETAQGISTSEQAKQQNLNELLEKVYIETIPGTFFGFLLSLKELDRKYAFDFFMIAIPAIFYDLIAPLALTVVLFLMGFEKKNNPVIMRETSEPLTLAEISERPIPQAPDIEEINRYIESALQDDFSILPDDAIGNIEERQCKKFREYLMSFIYKGKPIITERDGRFVSMFNRLNLKRFIELQYNVHRKGE